MIGEIYRHPNGAVNHFVNDLETALDKIDDKMTTVIVGDMNIHIMKFENDNSVNYLTSLLPHLPGFLSLKCKLQAKLKHEKLPKICRGHGNQNTGRPIWW